ncbi:MAG TPA: diguanylate cyclase [Nitrospira sp.]|nr:diguanylate cyclase [Nitrospira sp.]
MTDFNEQNGCVNDRRTTGIPGSVRRPSAIPTFFTDRPHRLATVLVGLISIVMVFCIGWGACTIERRLVATAGHSLVQTAGDAADKLEAMIAGRQGDIEALASSPLARGADREALTAYLYRLLNSYRAYQWIGVTDAQGRVIAVTDPDGLSQDRSMTRWFQQAAKSQGLTILDARATVESKHRLAITLTAPIRTPDGRFHGVVAAMVEIPYLVDLLDRTTRVLQGMDWSEDSHIEYQLLNGYGDLIGDSSLRQEGRLNLRDLELPSAQLVATSERGFVEEDHLRRHAPVITAYARVHLPNASTALRWGILIRVDRDSILAPIRTFLQNLMLVTTLIVVPMAALLLWLVKRLHREWDLAKQESERASQAEAGLKARAEALHALVDAAKRMASAAYLDELLQELLHIAQTTTGARCAAVGIFDETKSTLTRYLTIDLDEQAARAIGALPVEGGLLTCLAKRGGVLRIADLSREGGPLEIRGSLHRLTSFLGISLRRHGELFGQLYLVDKLTQDGSVAAFTELDDQILMTLAAQVGVSIENLQLLYESKERAMHDSLTGLLNHSAILDALTREMVRAEREHEPLAVLMADLDHFKRINDTYGHRVGDVVIREVGGRIREAVRRYDLVGRVGGEEFLIILPGCDEGATAEFAERIRCAVAGNAIETSAGPLSVTISIGAATWSSGKAPLPHVLWETADQALYRVKHNGRNSVAIATLPHNSSYQEVA